MAFEMCHLASIFGPKVDKCADIGTPIRRLWRRLWLVLVPFLHDAAIRVGFNWLMPVLVLL